MNFKERENPTVVTKALISAVPYIIISKDAIAKMFLYVDKCAEEVGWLGTAYRSGKEIFINNVFLFDQEVHSTTTEITPQGLSDFATEILEQEDGVEIWNNMKVWGHSHVRMAVNPSMQDDKQMETFQTSGHDWFIRIIANKNGDLKVDLYDYETGLIYIDLPWSIQECEEELRLYMQIQELEKQLDAFRTERIEFHDAYITEEMKVKVRKKTYVTTYANQSNYANRNNQGTTTLNPHSTMKPSTGGVTTNGGNTNTGIDSDSFKKKQEDAPTVIVSGGNVSVGRSTSINMIETDDEVRDTFTWYELVELAESRDLEELQDALQLLGYFNYFSEDDLETILRVAYKVRGMFEMVNKNVEVD